MGSLRRDIERLGPVAALVTIATGLGLWGFAATSPRPSWAPDWSGWVLSGFGWLLMILGAWGLVLWAGLGDTPSTARETRELLNEGAVNVSDLLGRLNAYVSYEEDGTAREYWTAQALAWANWVDRLLAWRLPDVQKGFMNDAGRNSSDYHGVKWQHDLATWMDVRLERIKEFVRDADHLQGRLGPVPTKIERVPPTYPGPPRPIRSEARFGQAGWRTKSLGADTEAGQPPERANGPQDNAEASARNAPIKGAGPYPISMADQAAIKAVTKRLRKRWKKEEGPLPQPPQLVFPSPIAPEPAPSSVQLLPDPTPAEIEARAEFLVAQVQDLSINTFGSRNIHFGINQARIIAKDELRKEISEGRPLISRAISSQDQT